MYTGRCPVRLEQNVLWNYTTFEHLRWGIATVYSQSTSQTICTSPSLRYRKSWTAWSAFYYGYVKTPTFPIPRLTRHTVFTLQVTVYFEWLCLRLLYYLQKCDHPGHVNTKASQSCAGHRNPTLTKMPNNNMADKLLWGGSNNNEIKWWMVTDLSETCNSFNVIFV